MGNSYRIRTEVGVDQTINIQLDQDWEFLEILSLTIQQNEVFPRACADYGVVVGRVTANNGFGIPNARVALFVPISSIDESNPIIQSIYPYKSPSDKNEDGYRYNLLPYEKSYSKHAATGTLPTRLDVLTGNTTVEIYDKYYKFTAKTNDSGDYMIMGVPLGTQTFVMDVDLSDIGEFSLTPQDLIRMGLATEAQVAGNQFNTSTDLNSLPQIINIQRSIEVSPLWGDPTICQLAINRLDFDLRDDANVDIQPTSVFMGSIFSSGDKFRVRKNCKPKDNLGNLCGLTAGPGQILAIRQTIGQDSDGNPVLEEYELEQGGNVIDGNGTWLIELPMNLEYLTTNEFGEKVISYDPTIGIPSKAKYRFKIKWQQSPTLNEQTRRAYYLVPNVKEYGWTGSADPNFSGNQNQKEQLSSSYYFGLAWTGYTRGFGGTQLTNRLNEAINGDDTFYEFKFNRVYTVSGLIDQWKKGAKGRFIGIKEIDDDACESTINKFPVNDGFRNFDIIFFIFSLLFQILQFSGLFILIIAHLILGIYSIVIGALCFLCGIKIPVINVRPFGFICALLGIKCEKKDFTIRLPMITYPECEACQCKDTEVNNSATLGGANGVLSYVSFPSSYFTNLQSNFVGNTPSEDIQMKALIYADSMAGNNDNVSDLSLFKVPKSGVVRFESDDSDGRRFFTWSDGLPLGERINIFNSRDAYFDNLNKMRVTFNKPQNLGTYHYDNTITVLANQQYLPGDLLTTVDPGTSTDLNFLYTAETANGVFQGITGTTISGSQVINVKYATSQLSDQTVNYNLSTGTTIGRQLFPMDREYFQVVTAMTVAEASLLWNSGSTQSFPNILASGHKVVLMKHRATIGYNDESTNYLNPFEMFDSMRSQYVLILQRGVDPYSPKFPNEYSIGRIFGRSETDLVFTAETRVNIPIQKLPDNSRSVQRMNQNETFYPSYFFTPGNDFSGFTSSTVGYYGSIDSSVSVANLNTSLMNGVRSRITSTSNEFYFSTEDADKYSLGEDVSGLGYFYFNLRTGLSFGYADVDTRYTSLVMYPQFQTNPMPISVKTQNVFRNDRLPSSDQLNGPSWDATTVALLQQNNNFQFYLIPELDGTESSPGYSTGADQVTPDIEGMVGATNVLASFNCETMVSLNCYQGFGTNFEVNSGCTQTDAVERGCYLFLKRPILDLGKDLKTYGEWGYRFRFFYGLCRGVLSQSFMNNWINGGLYAFPIQVDTRWNRLNQPSSVFCKDVIYFDIETNNFYYRSSPYNVNTSKFVGKIADPTSANSTNLLYPTTIMNMGMKDSFYGEIIFDPDTKGYVLPNLNPTSYGDVSDLVNLFVISRITDGTVLGRILSIGDNSINQLFSRPERRVDGDLAQLMSINSEMGVIKFSPEYYETVPGSTDDPTNILGTPGNPTMAVWFSSNTQDLQFKDYLTPGRINFRPNNTATSLPFTYGIKSQVVPFYQWRLQNTTTIFGGQLNTWATSSSDIVQGKRYQSLDRTSLVNPSYFRNSNTSLNDQYARGYIFSVDANGNYSTTGAVSNKFIVGAPFQFYFGIIKGQSALDRFKQKYSILE
jgi:hypothetical protein